MKVLVTGAAGFIGAHVCRQLTGEGIAVRAMLSPRGGAERLASLPKLELVTADITAPGSLATALEGITHVIHLAALPIDWGPEEVFERINHQGTRNVLDAAIAAGARRFVHVSTWAGEAFPNAYSRSKQRAEDYVRKRSFELETVIIRPALYPYGPGDRIATTQMFQAIEQGRFGFVGGGRSLFGTIYVEDLARALSSALTAPFAAGKTFTIADEEPRSWMSWAGDVAVALGVRPPRLSVPTWLAWAIALALEGLWKAGNRGTPPPLTRYRVRVASKDLVFPDPKVRGTLGFAPQTSRPEGLIKTLEWYRSDCASRAPHHISNLPALHGFLCGRKEYGRADRARPGS